jgi:hypothetical protein
MQDDASKSLASWEPHGTEGAYGGVPVRHNFGCFDRYTIRRTVMTEIRRGAETEPVGIVISRGSRAEAAPKFLAYVWGPAPEAAAEETSKAA